MKTNQKEIKELTDEILKVTMEMSNKHPEIYQYLNETPFSNSSKTEGIDPYCLEEYLITIRLQLKIYNKSADFIFTAN